MKLTLGFKKDTCSKCANADKRAMRQGRPFCSSQFKARNGHCVNFNAVTPKRKKGGE